MFKGFPTQTGLYCNKIWQEACNVEFRNKRDCTIYVKVLISSAVTGARCASLFLQMQKAAFLLMRLKNLSKYVCLRLKPKIA